MAKYDCTICGYVHDEQQEGPFGELPDDYQCPICGAGADVFERHAEAAQATGTAAPGDYLKQWRRPSDETEAQMAVIHRVAETGESRAGKARHY